VKLLYSLSHGSIRLPPLVVTDPPRLRPRFHKAVKPPQYYSPLSHAAHFAIPIALDLPALLHRSPVTVLLIYGIFVKSATPTRPSS